MIHLLCFTGPRRRKLSSQANKTLFESCVNVSHCVSKDSKTQASQNIPQRKEEPA